LKATGLAHEVRDSTNINKTSHVENCETSAIGRALAALGLAGTEYASGDEVSNAIINQHVKEATGKLSDLIQALLRHHDSVVAIKAGIASGEFSGASEEWFSLDEETKQALWVAPTKGGVFTTQEIEVIKSQEFRVSFYGTDTES
jgi:N-acetylglucosamine kinase-like BadF-type ATPase